MLGNEHPVVAKHDATAVQTLSGVQPAVPSAGRQVHQQAGPQPTDSNPCSPAAVLTDSIAHTFASTASRYNHRWTPEAKEAAARPATGAAFAAYTGHVHQSAVSLRWQAVPTESNLC